MKDGALEMYVNHPEVAVGATSEVDIGLRLGGSSAVASDSHVLIKVRPQIAPIRVSFWSAAEVRVGAVVFAGSLNFPDAYLCVSDTERLTRLTRRIPSAGMHFVSVSVDDPGRASRIFVTLRGDELDSGTNAPTFSFGSAVPVGPTALTSSGLLECVLSEYDSPRDRLAEAVRIVSGEVNKEEIQFLYNIRKIVEWLRWISPRVSFEVSSEAGDLLKRELDQLTDRADPSAAAGLADRVLRRLSSDCG
jgi:hypothetical protein